MIAAGRDRLNRSQSRNKCVYAKRIIVFLAYRAIMFMLLRRLKCVTAVIWVPYHDVFLSPIMLLMVLGKRQCKTRLLCCCKIAHLSFYQFIDYWTVNSFFFRMSWGSVNYVKENKPFYMHDNPLKISTLITKSEIFSSLQAAQAIRRSWCWRSKIITRVIS